MPVSGTTRMTPPMMMNACSAEDRGQAGGEDLLERALGADRDAEAGADDQHERDEDGGRAEQAELLADRGEDEVVLHLGDLVRAAEAEPGAVGAAVRQREQRLDDLVALALVLRPRVRARWPRGSARCRTSARPT